MLEAAEAAEAEAARLESLVADGDESVELDDIIAAEQQSRWARLKAKGLKARRERAAERHRLEQLANYRRLIIERFGEHDGDVLAAFDDAVAAVDRLIAKAVEHNEAFHEISEGLLLVLTEDDGDDVVVQRGSQIHLPRQDVFLSPLDAGGLVAEAARRALIGRRQPTKTISGGQVTQLAEHHVAERRAYRLDVGDLYGDSDRIRRVARLVAERAAADAGDAS
jgi:hypothetical protein